MNDAMHIMIVDDERIIRESFARWFLKTGHTVNSAASAHEALSKLDTAVYDVLFVDIKMPRMSGLELLEKVKREYPDTIVVIITAFGSIETAVEAMKLGAADYLLKPFRPEQLDLVIQKLARQKKLASECSYLRDHVSRMSRFDNIIGQSPAMNKLFRLIPEVAASDAAVLIVGETGTGKELVAKAIHAKSPRCQNPFIAINCGALPDALLETELFGHQKGSFTGATQNRKGFLEVVSGGTLFLDEVGEISSKMQVDLLRVLDEKKIRRIGSSQTVDVDFRLVSATRRDTGEMAHGDWFREDFFYRINVITIQLPALKQRKEDIPLLVDHFLRKYSEETNKQIDQVDADALLLLSRYSWPGNIRELENAVERAVVLARSVRLGPDDFAFLQQRNIPRLTRLTLQEHEREYICDVLRETDWNVTRAAKLLGINRVTLHKKIKRFDLKRI